MPDTSQEQIFDPIKLEKLLIKGWTEFIEPRKLLNFLKTNAEKTFQINNAKIQTLLISNCEIESTGISLWINYNIVNSNSPVNITHKAMLNLDGTIKITQTI
jgi:hypothetical protein